MNALIIIGKDETLSTGIGQKWRATVVHSPVEAAQLRSETEDALAVLNVDVIPDAEMNEIRLDDKMTLIAISEDWARLKSLPKGLASECILRVGPWEEQLDAALKRGIENVNQKRLLRRLKRSLRTIRMENEIGKMHRGIALELCSIMVDLHQKARQLGAQVVGDATTAQLRDLMTLIDHGRRLNKTLHHLDRASETPQICPLNKTLGNIAAALSDQTGDVVTCRQLKQEAYLGCEVADLNRLILTLISALQPYSIKTACHTIEIENDGNMATIVLIGEANEKELNETELKRSLNGVNQWAMARGGTVKMPKKEKMRVAVEINLPTLWL